MEICRLEHASKSYRGGELVSPLRDISLTVNSGDFIAVEGPSGIGKSTLLYVMGTLLELDEGRLWMEGAPVDRMSDRERTVLRGTKLGFLLQDAAWIQALTIRENLRFTQQAGGQRKPDSARVEELLRRLGLEDRGDFFPHQLSGGQRRRAMAARCLVNRPRLILADEPTNDLDKHWAGEIISLLSEAVACGAGVVMVTHDSSWTVRATARYRLENGMLEPVLPFKDEIKKGQIKEGEITHKK